MKRVWILAVFAAAATIRIAYWHRVGGPIQAGDSPQFLAWARLFAGEGSATGVESPSGFLLKQLYPALLMPVFLFNLPLTSYVACLHIALSAATVAVICMIATELEGATYGLSVGALSAVYPSFLFWLPYILSETLFLFCLALFALAYVHLLAGWSFGRFVRFCGAALLLLFGRPVSTVLIVTAITVLVYRALAKRGTAKRAAAILITGWIAATAAIATVIATRPGAYAAVAYNPWVAQSLWLSSRVSNSDLPALQRAMDEGEALSWTERAERGKAFIAAHPIRISMMAGERLVSFWFPWVFASTWSTLHRLVDAGLSLALVLGTAAALLLSVNRQRYAIGALAVLAVSLSILSAVTQIEPDARYRLPAEFLLLLTAPLGAAAIFQRCR